MLRDYKTAESVCMSFLKPTVVNDFFEWDHDKWFFWNLTQKLGSNNSEYWSSIWGYSIRIIWKWKNNSVWDKDFMVHASAVTTILKIRESHTFVVEKKARIDSTWGKSNTNI